jgi:hypothetical protein
MSVIVTAVLGERLISASQTHTDGSTSPVPGSPFLVTEAPRKLLALGSNLLVQGENSVSVFALKENGSLQQTDLLPAPLLRDAVVNSSDSTVYVLDQNAVSGFRVQNGRMLALPGSPYPVAAGEANEVEPSMLVLESSGRAVYVTFASTAHAPGSMAVLNRESDGSLNGLSGVTSAPEEIRQAISAAEAGPTLKGRLAAVVSLQKSQ